MSLAEVQNNLLAAINALPAEILTHIFHLAADAERCVHYDDESDEIRPSVLLDSLPQVCSYWRHVSTELCALWSHIDLIDWGDPCNRLYSRARLWAKRARDSPLDIHIHGRSSYQAEKFQELADFLAPLMKQTRSLETEGNASPRLIHSTFSCWFNNSTPGTLTRVSLFDSWRIPFHSVGLIPVNAIANSCQLPTWSEQFEEFFRPVTVLRLRGGFPPLHSHAYHGLVELQLHAMSHFDVTQAQLMAALSASPGLRTLVVRVRITKPMPDDAQFLPVQLENLEELSVIDMRISHYGVLLRMLAPGAKPLKMSIELRAHNFSERYGAELDNFFKRSKVVALRVKGSGVREWLSLSLSLESLLHLRTLFLQDHVHKGHSIPENDTNTIRTPLMRLQLHELYISECALYAQEFKDFIASHSICTLGIQSCTTIDSNQEPYNQLEKIREFISEVHPHVKYLDSVGLERALRLWEFAS